MKTPIILDTDLGTDIDDVYALVLAIHHPSLDLKGVTTVYGDVQARAKLAAKILRLSGCEHIPVHAGIRVPQARLKRGDIAPDFTDFLNHTEYVTEDDPEFGQLYPDAIEFILQSLSTTPEPIGLIGIGPWTNLAEVLRSATPAQRQMIRFVALMGGEPNRMIAEHNVVCDPEGADSVLTSGLPIFMGSLDVTKQMILTIPEVETFLGNATAPVHKGLYETTRLWLPCRGAKPGPVLYDLIPVFWAADPSLVKTAPMSLRVETLGVFSRGFTVPMNLETQYQIGVSLEIDTNLLKTKLLRILGITGPNHQCQ